MTIEFQTQYATVNDKLIGSIRSDILELSHLSREISRAEVILKEDKTIIPSENQMCEIRLTIFGDDLLVHRRTGSFEQSAREVLKELKKLVKQQVARRNEPPDITTSTIKVK